MGFGTGPYIKKQKVGGKIVETLVRDIVFDSINTFDELFKSASKTKAQGLIYCMISGQDQAHSSLYVEPNEMLKEFVKTKMLDFEVYYEIVIYDDGTALVLAKYQSILGSRWLADIKTDSIPKE
jgi:hypothetical protein